MKYLFTTFLSIIISCIFLAFIVSGCGHSNFFRQRFEEYTHIEFPPSGKIVDTSDNGFLALDWYCFGNIEMDTLDYMKILHEIQMRNDSSFHSDVVTVTYRRFTLSDSETEYAYYEEHQDSHGRRYWLSFHRNKRMIKCFMESI